MACIAIPFCLALLVASGAGWADTSYTYRCGYPSDTIHTITIDYHYNLYGSAYCKSNYILIFKLDKYSLTILVLKTFNLVAIY